MTDRTNLPTLAELTEDLEISAKTDQLNLLLSQSPPDKWVKDHPFIKQEVEDGQGGKRRVPYKYLPIDKTEHLLRKIFKSFRIEITGQGVAFNGVWVTVRIHFLNPITGEWQFHDGIGAEQLQTKSGSSPAELANINNGAISMAFPKAKTLAVKDACDHFGSLFGANLNRRDVVAFTPDKPAPDTTMKKDEELPFELVAAIAEADVESLGAIFLEHKDQYMSNPKFMQLLEKRKSELKNASTAQ